jgi:hypothetical protein
MVLLVVAIGRITRACSRLGHSGVESAFGSIGQLTLALRLTLGGGPNG